MVALQACLLAAMVWVPAEIEVVKFTSEFCAPCRAMEPVLQQVAAQGFPVTRVDIDQRRDVAQQYQVTSVPTIFLVRQGQVIDRIEGALSAESLLARIASHQNANVPIHDAGQQTGLAAGRATLTDEERDRPGVRGVASPGGSTRPEIDRPELDRIEQRAHRATVRIRVEDPEGESSGTGTIVDVHGQEALVLTCGHLFRDSQGKGSIAVDLFATAEGRTVQGTLIRFDLKRDLALVAIPANEQMDAIPIAGPTFHVAQGQRLFSVGCNEGADPTVMRGQLKAINKYLGPENLVVSGRPIYGRSGGGLFSYDGRLIGVCNAADPELNEGLYAAFASIHRHLDDAKLSFIYRDDAGVQVASAETDAAPRKLSPLPGRSSPTNQPTDLHAASPRDDRPRGRSDVSPDGSLPWLAQGAEGAEPDGAEVICIIRSKTDPAGENKVVVLDRPSRDFLQRLTDEQRDQQSRQMTRLRTRPASQTFGTAPDRIEPLHRTNRVGR